MITSWSGIEGSVGAQRPLVLPYAAPLAALIIPQTQRGTIAYNQIKSRNRQGSGQKFQMYGGVAAPVSGNVPVYDINGDIVDSGTPPSSGGGITQLTGDVTAGPGSGSQVSLIPNSTVTLAKIQNAAASSKLLGSGASGSGSPYSEISLGTGLSMSGSTLNASGYPTPTTITPSGVSSASITSCITSSYRDYEIRFSDIVMSTAGAFLQAQVSTNNGSTWDTASSYQANAHYTSINAGADGILSSLTGTSWNIIPLNNSNASTSSISARYTLFNPLGASTYKQIFGQAQQTQNSDGSTYLMEAGFRYLNINAINAIKFIASSGTFSGTITMQPLPL